MMLYQTQKTVEDVSYATQCYSSQQADYCERFTQTTLAYTSELNASCPFAAEMCKSAFGNILLDSGDIDSMQHLGINKGPRFTVSYRTHCAPVVTKGYTENITASYFNRPLLTYKYGTDGDDDFVYEHELHNKTYQAVAAFLSPGGTYKIS